MNLFVTAIGTDSGKTVVSSILCKALKADYWKPIQSGITIRDSELVEKLVPSCKIYDEVYLLNEPTSPHKAAELDGVSIELAQIKLPQTKNHLIIEGAGGVMVPLTNQLMVLDLIKHLDVKVVLVVNLYLGAINHALLTIDKLKSSGVVIKGLVFNGSGYNEGKDFITSYSKLPVLLELVTMTHIDEATITQQALKVKLN